MQYSIHFCSQPIGETDDSGTNYFKEYYKRNKSKFEQRNHNRPSNRKYFYVVEVGDKKYCFPNKKDINIQKVCIADMIKNEFVIVKPD